MGGSTQTVAPTASSSLTVTLISTTTVVCTVAGFVITAVSPGTCSITASRLGNSNYEAAADVIQTFAITGVINVAAIAGVTAPVSGATPVNTTTAGTGYTGAVSWASSGGALVGNFAAATIYTATITLTATSNYTLTGVSANFFTVAGATSVTHLANSGVITAVFPATAKTTQATLSITSLTTSTKAYPYSQALSITTSGGSGSGATTFAITSGGTASGCSLSDSTATATITATTIGTCLIQATKATDATYDATTSAAVTFTFTKVSQRLLFSTPADMTIGGSFLTDAKAFPDDSLTVTLTSTTMNICTVAGLTITAIASGTCSITASQAGNENYEAAANVTRTFVVIGVINVAAIAGVTAPVIGAIPVDTVTATSQYTGNVYWEPSAGTFAAATVYTATITLTPKSGYTLTGVSANFFTITGATSVTHLANSGVITAVFPATAKMSQSITFTDPADISYGISPSSLSATSSSGLTVAFTSATSGVCTVSGTTVTIVSAGICTINAGQAGNSNYEAASQVSQSFTIAKASQSITFTDPADITYGQSPSSLSATSTSTLTVAFTTATSAVCTVSGTTVTIVSAGTCTINANQAGDANYQAASQVSQSFTIAKATQSITFGTPSAMTVGGSTQTVTPTASSSLTVTLTSTTTGVCTVAGFVITAVASGACSITASQAGNANYEAAPDVIRTFSIARTISTAAISGVTFPVAEGTPVMSVTSTAQYTGTVTWSGSPVTFAPTTTYTATITLTPISGYTLSGLSPNFFTVAGATSVTNSADSGIITAVFPATGVGAPRALAISTQPTGAASESTLGTQPVIRIIDSGGNTVTSYTATIRASISSGSGTLSGTRNVETSSGIARFTDLAITGTAGTFTLTFTAPTLSDTTSNNLTITTGPATKVVISRAPVGTQRKTAFTTQPQITIKDASNNTVTSSTAVITATVTSGFNPRSIIGSNTATAVSGVASFSDLGLDGYGGSDYTITFSADGLTNASTTIALTGINCDGKSFTCRLGDTGPGGGKVIYVASGTFIQSDATGSMCSSECKYLEAAPNTEALTYIYQWSENTNNTIGTTSTAIGTGYSNTLKIIGQSGAGTSGAASAARNYRGPNNLTDWFLPSIDELYELSFFNSFFGGFPASEHWSSSEVNGLNARVYNFPFNLGTTRYKSGYFYIRPVRAF